MRESNDCNDSRISAQRYWTFNSGGKWFAQFAPSVQYLSLI
jgi:hypothetical protein